MISKNGEDIKTIEGIPVPTADLGTERSWSQIFYAPITTQPRHYPYYTTGEWFKDVRKMRVDPTIAIVRDLTQALILSAEWTIETTSDAPEGVESYIETEVKKWRDHIIRHSINGMVDFGWQAFEKVYELDEENTLRIKKLKPLIQDRTQILIDPDNGDFIGIYQIWDQVILPSKEVFITAWQIEGTDWYGRPLMKNVEQAYNDWNDSNNSANTYDRKVAGSHWVIYYPPGVTKINGIEKDNYQVASDLINVLQYSTGIAIPSYVEAFVEELNKDTPDAWKVELLGDRTNQQQNFVDRQRYLDSLKVRGFGFPERSVIEGQFGTKAEAGVHQNIAMVIMDDRQKIVVDSFNYQIVPDLLKWEYGPQSVGTVCVKTSSVSDTHYNLLKDIYDKILDNDEGLVHEVEAIDLPEIRQILGVPTETEMEETDDEMVAEPNADAGVE